MNILLMSYSGIRWLVLLVTMIDIGRFHAGWLRKSWLQGMDRRRMAGFSGLMALQMTLGLILPVWNRLMGSIALKLIGIVVLPGGLNR